MGGTMKKIVSKEIVKYIVAKAIFWLPTLIGIILLWTRGINPYQVFQASFWPVLFLIQLWFFLTPFRTLTATEMVNGYALGMTVVTHLIWLCAALLRKFVSIESVESFLTSKAIFGNTNLVGTFVAPISEEVLKAAIPLLLLVVVSGLRKDATAKIRTPIDFMLLTAASGAGFSTYENLFRALNDDFGYLFPKFASEASWRIGPIRFLPELLKDSFYRGNLVWIGHSTTAAAVGIAFGVAYYYRKKIFVYLVPILMLWLVTFDHMLWNYNIPKSKIWWKSTLGNMTFHGRLVPFLMAILVGFAIWITVRQLLELRKTNRFKAYKVKQGSRKIKWWALPQYYRKLLMVAFGTRNALYDGKKKASKYAKHLYEVIEDGLNVDGMSARK